mmetsp:Transcript_21575/g.59923  ORF Transcript_21575/g.59923 Transcript_21575/m.59923 type:complete len:263 (+) Transcript_21575:1141-1929(+)
MIEPKNGDMSAELPSPYCAASHAAHAAIFISQVAMYCFSISASCCISKRDGEASSPTSGPPFCCLSIVSFILRRAWISPSGQRWQCRHSAPFSHPLGFQNQAQGLQPPSPWSTEPLDTTACGASATAWPSTWAASSFCTSATAGAPSGLVGCTAAASTRSRSTSRSGSEQYRTMLCTVWPPILSSTSCWKPKSPSEPTSASKSSLRASTKSLSAPEPPQAKHFRTMTQETFPFAISRTSPRTSWKIRSLSSGLPVSIKACSR